VRANPFDISTLVLAKHAYFNLLLAAASTVPVVATGFVAWQWALEGQTLKGTLLIHQCVCEFRSAVVGNHPEEER
jgi:hypothetical protein